MIESAATANHRLDLEIESVSPDTLDSAVQILGDALLSVVRSGADFVKEGRTALHQLTADPRPEIRAAVPVIASALARATGKAPGQDLKNLLKSAGFGNATPGEILISLGNLHKLMHQNGDAAADGILRLLVGARQLFLQARTPGVDELDGLCERLVQLDAESLARLDALASSTRPGANSLIRRALYARVRRNQVRPEWQASSLASEIALEVCHRLEARVPSGTPWWIQPRYYLIAGVLILVFLVGWLFAGLLRSEPEPKPETTSVAEIESGTKAEPDVLPLPTAPL